MIGKQTLQSHSMYVELERKLTSASRSFYTFAGLFDFKKTKN